MFKMEKTGNFISERRKKLGMTQKDLAERVGLTDKAVSKWERGKSIPDASVVPDLCEALQISINEYLSGEEIQSEDYHDKAEENIIDLIDKGQKQDKNNRVIIGAVVIGSIMVIAGIYAFSLMPNGGIASFLDLPGFVLVVGLVFIVHGLLGEIGHTLLALRISFLKEPFSERQLEDGKVAIRILVLENIVAGFFLSLTQVIAALNGIMGHGDIAKVISVLLLPSWYGMCISFLWLIIYLRLHRMKGDMDE